MPTEAVIWYPYWYELDQSIAVGQVAEFDFFKTPPDYLPCEGRRVFYHGLLQVTERQRTIDRQRVRIVSIRHPQLGAIRAIDTEGLDYTFHLADGQVQKVEAEETPGVVYQFPEPITDWRIWVDIEPSV